MILAVLVLLAVVVVLWIFSAPIAQWSRSAQSFDVVAFLKEHYLAAAMLGGCLLILALIWLPKWQAARPELTPQVRLEVEDNARKTLAEIVGGAALLTGLYFTWSSLEVSREGQITDRFTKAIEQIGNDKLQIRLGGIYALERIARESEIDYWPIMEVLTAYVRENAPWPSKTSKDTPPPQDNPFSNGDPAVAQGQPLPKPATDVQAVLTVLGRRNRTYEKKDQRLDLTRTDLRGAKLRLAHLARANFTGAQLGQADLGRAHLEGANFAGAQLGQADLTEAHLGQALLGAVQLQGADLRDAHLEGALLLVAQLKGARNLTITQLSTVKTLYLAQLDLPLHEQIQQHYPQLLEKP